MCVQVCEQVFGDLTSKEFGHMVVNTYIQRERERESERGREQAKERLCEMSEGESEREVSSFVSGGSRKGSLKHILYPYLRSDGSDKKKQPSIASPSPHICGVGKSVSINTFALGDDGLQIGH